MNRSVIFTAALAVSMMMGCSSPAETDSTTQEDISTTASALSKCDREGEGDDDENCDCDGPGKKAFTLTSLNGNTITGVNGFGQTFTASFTSNTNFRQANLSRFQPSTPIRPSLIAYNAAVQSHANVLGAVEDLVSFGAHARVSVRKGTVTIRSFRPVP